MSKFSAGQYSCAAITTPTSMPTIPQTTVMIANCRTTLSLYVSFVGALAEIIWCTHPFRLTVSNGHRTFAATLYLYVLARRHPGGSTDSAVRAATLGRVNARCSSVPLRTSPLQIQRPTLPRFRQCLARPKCRSERYRARVPRCCRRRVASGQIGKLRPSREVRPAWSASAPADP